MAEMTMRQRMLAVIRGEPHDRVPFVSYRGMAPWEDAWKLIGRNNLGVLAWTPACNSQTPNCHREVEQVELDGRPARRTALHTPAGKLTDLWVDAAIAAHAHEHFIKAPADYKILLALLRDQHYTPNVDGWLAAWKEIGDDGLPHTSIGRTAYQALWVEWVNPFDLAAHMADEPALMEEVFAAMNADMAKALAAACELVRAAPVPYVLFPDNITAPMIGEANFRKYCAPMYLKLRDMLDEIGSDIPVAVHTDGDLRPLWKAFAESRVGWFDSMSPPPDNDTSVADALREWPDAGVGINFPSSVHLKSEQEIYETTMEILAQGGRSNRLQIQISEDTPPGAWEKSYPQIVRAIDEFCS
jgi:hypothetical protein